MKGTIVKCLEELVVSKFGRETWDKTLDDVGLSTTTMFLAVADVDDADVIKVIEALCKNLGISLNQAAEAFGDYWVNDYSQKLYGAYYAKHASAMEFLMDMDNVHVAMTRSMANASPPRFEYEKKGDKTLIMTYKSRRGLIDFAVGLVKGVGTFYHEDLQITKLGADRIQIVFP